MWSKLQRKLYDIIDPAINLQVHCSQYPGRGKNCLNGIPRFWITLNGTVIFDFLHDLTFLLHSHSRTSCFPDYPYEDDVMGLCGAVIQYISASPDSLMDLKDQWGLFDILIAADRRVGKRRWPEVYKTRSEAARKVLIARGYVVPEQNHQLLDTEINEILNLFAASNKALKTM